MKRCFSAPVVSLALVFLLSLLAPAAHAGSDTSFRPARVRAFAPETPSSLVVREGRSRFIRLTLADACPALAGAERIAFQIGAALTVADEPGAGIPVVRNSTPTGMALT